MVMSMKGRQEYINSVRLRYYRSSREEQGIILDELCAVTGYHRKSAIRAIGRVEADAAERHRRAPWLRKAAWQKRGRRGTYNNDPECCSALKGLWFETDQMCAPNFKEAIPVWLPFYEEEHGVSPSTHKKLLTMSASTIGRILEPSKCRTKRRCGTKPGSLLRTEIPIRTDVWDITCPGYLEADTVAHCGGSMSGEFAWTLTLTDIDTGWTECRCVWHKLATNVRDAIEDVEKILPFKVLAFDSDNGSEFINHCLVHFFGGKFIPFTRSREYHKNDNCHVEQKNYTQHARFLATSASIVRQ